MLYHLKMTMMVSYKLGADADVDGASVVNSGAGTVVATEGGIAAVNVVDTVAETVAASTMGNVVVSVMVNAVGSVAASVTVNAVGNVAASVMGNAVVTGAGTEVASGEVSYRRLPLEIADGRSVTRLSRQGWGRVER